MKNLFFTYKTKALIVKGNEFFFVVYLQVIHYRCVTFNAIHIMMGLYFSLKREPTQRTNYGDLHFE